jgi:hypothetical protein
MAVAAVNTAVDLVRQHARRRHGIGAAILA